MQSSFLHVDNYRWPKIVIQLAGTLSSTNVRQQFALTVQLNEHVWSVAILIVLLGVVFRLRNLVSLLIVIAIETNWRVSRVSVPELTDDPTLEDTVKPNFMYLSRKKQKCAVQKERTIMRSNVTKRPWRRVIFQHCKNLSLGMFQN